MSSYFIRKCTVCSFIFNTNLLKYLNILLRTQDIWAGKSPKNKVAFGTDQENFVYTLGITNDALRINEIKFVWDVSVQDL